MHPAISSRSVLRSACLLLPFALSTAPALAAETLQPTISILVDGSSAGSIPLSLDAEGVAWVADEVSLVDDGEWAIALDASLDPDPQITYGLVVTDFGAPTTFGFIFSLPIVPTAAPGSVTHGFSSLTVDGGGGLGTPVTALDPAGVPVDGDSIAELAVYLLSTDAGATLLNAGMDLGASFVGTSPSGVQGPFGEGPIAGPAGAGFYDLMRIQLSFSMDGGGDIFGAAGVATVVPEPGTAALLGLGMGGLALIGRRREPPRKF
jgi:hypothetical protein